MTFEVISGENKTNFKVRKTETFPSRETYRKSHMESKGFMKHAPDIHSEM